MPDVPATGRWSLRASVPGGTFTLAVETDDKTAQAEHAAFAQRCRPLIPASQNVDEPELQQELIAQLGMLRRLVASAGLGYLGALAGPYHDRPVLLLLGIAASPLEMPDGVRAESLLAGSLRCRYPAGQTEEFPTAVGHAVGIRRFAKLPLPYSPPNEDRAGIETGIAQALVPFPEAGLLGVVTGLCLTADGIELATAFTTKIAYRLSAIPQQPARPPDGHSLPSSS